MKIPQGEIWEYPGFPSLVVPYGPTNDFFYSGHMGGALISTLEWWKNKKNYMVYFGIITIFA